MTDRNEKPSNDTLPLVLFILSIVTATFVYGYAVGRHKVFPFRWVHSVEKQLPRLRSKADDPRFRPHHLFPAWHKTSGVRTHDRDAIQPGVVLLTGYWSSMDWKPGIRLIDRNGAVLHEWETDPARIWPTSPHPDRYAGAKNTSQNYVHGSYLFENGDVIFSIEYMGLVRMNAQGEVIWTVPFRTHHSVTRDEDGNFWVCGVKWIENNKAGWARLAGYPGMRPPLAEDFALCVTEDGEIIRKISILKALYEAGCERLIWQRKAGRREDVLHTNDVEPLPAHLADAYPLFEAGDLAISCLFISTVFVMDSQTGKIKWLCDEFLKQHDPDFVGDGLIQVFDNKTDYGNGAFLGGTEIVLVRPETGERTVRHPRTPEQRFYTKLGGKVQALPNGNLLITEARRARIFEVTPAGETAWEWIAEKYNEELVPEVLEGTFYDLTPETIAAW